MQAAIRRGVVFRMQGQGRSGMGYIPRSVDVKGLLQEKQDLLERISVIDGLLRFLGVELDTECTRGTPISEVPRLTLTQAAQEILREANGKPMHGSEILKRAKAMGVRVGGENPKNTLFGTLRRNERVFANVGGNQWVLVGFGGPRDEKRTSVGTSAEAKRRTDDRTDYQKCVEALSAIGQACRVGDLEAYLRDAGTPVPQKSIRSYIGKAHRNGEIVKVADGLYAARQTAPEEGGA